MHIITILAIIINILSIIVLLVGLLSRFEQPKGKALYGYCIAGSLLMYILSLSLVIIFEFVTKHILHSFILLLCIISIFVIGKIVKYETLKKYTIIQIMCFVVSLVTMLL